MIRKTYTSLWHRHVYTDEFSCESETRNQKLLDFVCHVSKSILLISTGIPLLIKRRRLPVQKLWNFHSTKESKSANHTSNHCFGTFDTGRWRSIDFGISMLQIHTTDTASLHCQLCCKLVFNLKKVQVNEITWVPLSNWGEFAKIKQPLE